jgi:ribonuclease-3
VDDAQLQVSRSLDYSFADENLLVEALTHRSLSAEAPDESSNERLEFLGDAVLGLVVATELYDAWDLAEGEMSKVRAAVVDESSLAAVAGLVGVGAALRLGKGEDASGGREKAPILADALEALIGAVYLDGGFAEARRVVMAHWAELIAERAEAPGGRDYKTRLQEILAKDGSVPEYRVVGSGPDHARRYAATVLVSGATRGRGVGTSKKRAEQAAARRALRYFGDPDA